MKRLFSGIKRRKQLKTWRKDTRVLQANRIKGRRRQNHKLTLVTLTPEQIDKAKQENGQRRKITHVLVCGPHGQIFGTEKFCLKYFDVWVEIFPLIFSRRVKKRRHRMKDFKHTPEMVTKLIEIHDSLL